MPPQTASNACSEQAAPASPATTAHTSRKKPSTAPLGASTADFSGKDTRPTFGLPTPLPTVEQTLFLIFLQLEAQTTLLRNLANQGAR